MEILEKINQYGADVIQIITGIVTVASLIAAVIKTPTKKGKLSKALKIVDGLALNVGNAKRKE